jgi:hypothetical protein
VFFQAAGVLLVSLVAWTLVQPSAPVLLVHLEARCYSAPTEDLIPPPPPLLLLLLLVLLLRPGHYKCEPSVIVGRPANREQLANLVKVRHTALVTIH